MHNCRYYVYGYFGQVEKKKGHLFIYLSHFLIFKNLPTKKISQETLQKKKTFIEYSPH